MYAALSSNSKLWWKGDVSETAAGSSCRMPLKKNLFFVLTFYQCMSMMQNYSNPFCFIHHPPLALMKAVYDFSLRPLGVDIMDVGVCVWVGGVERAPMHPQRRSTLKPSSLTCPQSWDLERRRRRRKPSSCLLLRCFLFAYEKVKAPGPPQPNRSICIH